MNYKLFSSSLVPQLNRLFGHATADDKSCYLVRLNSGFTEADLNKCLNFQPQTGGGYMFDAALAASTGICTVLAKGTNCVRGIDRNKISVSDSLLTATANGVPTHLILGGILPICLQVGTDVTLLYPDMNIKFDANGYKTQVIINAFTIPLTKMWIEGAWLVGDEKVAFDTSQFKTGSFTDYAGNVYTVTGNAKLAADGLGIDMGTTGQFTSTNQIDVNKSFTVEFDYHQSGVANYAEFCFFQIGTTIADRVTIAFDRSNELGFGLWNNVGGGDPGMKVRRDMTPYVNKLKTLTPIAFKYEYNATTNTHTLSLDGVVVDTFVYKILKPVSTSTAVYGGYGVNANAAYTPIIDKYRITQGA